MPQLIKKSSTLWEFRFYNSKKSPKSKSIYLSTNDGFSVQEIKTAYKELSLAFKKRQFDPWMDEIVMRDSDLPTVRKIADEYIELCKRKYAKGTARVYEGNINQLVDYIGGQTPIDDVNKAVVEMHINSFAKKTTRKSNKTSAQNLFNHAYQNGYIDRMMKFEASGGEGITPKDFLTVQELEEWEKYIIDTHSKAPYIVDMIYVTFFTGFRISETMNFKPKWVSKDLRYITYGDESFQPKRRDTGKLDDLPLLDEIKPRLRRLISNTDPEQKVFGRYSKGYLCDLVKKLAEGCFGDKHISMHSLRKSFAMYLINEKNIQPKALHEMMRHSEMNTTIKYYTDKEIDRLDEAINKKCGKSMVTENKKRNKNPRNLRRDNTLRLVKL